MSVLLLLESRCQMVAVLQKYYHYYLLLKYVFLRVLRINLGNIFRNIEL